MMCNSRKVGIAISFALILISLGFVSFFTIRVSDQYRDMATKYNVSYAIANRYVTLEQSCQVCSDCGGSPIDSGDGCTPVCFNLPYSIFTFVDYQYWGLGSNTSQTMNTTAAKICCYDPNDCLSDAERTYPSTYRFKIYYDILYPADWFTSLPIPVFDIVIICVFGCTTIFLLIVVICLGLGLKCRGRGYNAPPLNADLAWNYQVVK